MSKQLPPLPRSIPFPTGKVVVKKVKGLMESEKAFGMFNWVTREIKLDRSLSLNAAWLTLFHEAMHVIIMDAGIQMDEELEERLADTYAAYRVAEMLR